jgi:hypothetical protein
MVRFVTMPAKNANAIRNPSRRFSLPELPTTPATPKPTGTVHGHTALATTPASIVTMTAQK